MRAVVKDKKEPGLNMIDAPIPVPGPHQILIRLKSAAICGTDLHYYKWNQAAKDFINNSSNFPFPYFIGHEGSGIVEAVGELVTKIKPGQRVTAETHVSCGKCFQCLNGEAHNCPNRGRFFGCFSEYTVVDENYAFVLPDEMSFEEGSLMEPAGVAMRAYEEANLQPGDTVVVNGCGPIALMLIQILKQSLAARIIATDLNDYRLDIAKRFGAIPVHAGEEADVLIKELTKDRGGADVLFEMSGAAPAYQRIFDYIRKEGRLIVVGNPSGEVPINITKNVFLKGIMIKGINGRRIWSTWLHLSSLITSGKIDLSQVITHKFPLEEYDAAFQQAMGNSGKVLFTFEPKE